MAVYNQVIGKWNLSLNANWDQIRWTNFFGLGNETTVETTDRDFYRMRTRHYVAGAGLFRNLGKYQFLSLSTFYQNIKIMDDPERLIAKIYYPPKDLHDAKDFVGLQANYRYALTGDQIVPSKGADFSSSSGLRPQPL